MNKLAWYCQHNLSSSISGFKLSFQEKQKASIWSLFLVIYVSTETEWSRTGNPYYRKYRTTDLQSVALVGKNQIIL